MGSSVVAALRADNELAMALGFGFYANLAETTSAFGSGRLITDSVLVTDVVGDGAADGIYFIQSLGKERDSSGSLAENFERFPGPPRVLFVPQDADGVNGGAILLL